MCMACTDGTERPKTGRFNNSRPQTLPSTDPYGTSLRLKKIIQPRSGTMTSADVEKAIKLVMETSRNAVSVPVWNMLLGMIGRECRLELMWKTFNDVRIYSVSIIFVRDHLTCDR
jgi:hypothetical protein